MLISGRLCVFGLVTQKCFIHGIRLSQLRSRRMLTDLAERRKVFETKYEDKLRERLKREGVSDVEELKVLVSARQSPELVVPRTRREETSGQVIDTPVMRDGLPKRRRERRDASPVKPLANFMDVDKIRAKNRSPEEVSALWMMYHATRSRGPGYLSATIPLETYLSMSLLAAKYPSFILPLPRPPPVPESSHPAHEFYFLQWDSHKLSPYPSQSPTLPFDTREPSAAPVSTPPNPACTTVLFTPLQEYKLRQTFAQPHLVLTHYTDLATTHGIVLMRGELTPSSSSLKKYLLSPADAQLLAMGVQRFYLAVGDEGSTQRTQLVAKFHETPAEFRWEDLLVHADPMA